MKRIIVVVLIATFFTGCASVGDFSTFDKIGNALYKMPIQEQQIELLGTVQHDMTTTSILFMFNFGESTYAKMLELAKKTYNADEIINLRMDVIQSTYLFVYNTTTYRVTAQAIKYR